VGAGVYDRLAELGVPVTPYNGGETPFDKERFVNARAEDYWNLRESFEVGEVDIDELDDVLRCTAGFDQVDRGLSGAYQDRVEGRHAQARTPVT
jgi:hypothetical protein